jgi:anion-transporting  ArsA/GET3 family ATPase
LDASVLPSYPSVRLAREHIWDRQLVLVTGKGGVGKSVITAALARAAHQSGKRVLVAEVTPDVSTYSRLLAHFGHASATGEEPFVIEPRLFGARITPSTGHRLFLRAALRVRLVVDTAMKSAALTRFLMAAPTFPEIGTLYQLVTLLRAKNFDHVFVDLPATGHALALASLPKTVLRIVPSGLIGDAIREGLETMTDPRRGGAVVVTLPESMPITEAFELKDALRRLSIPVRAMILNKLPRDPFTPEEKLALDAYLAEPSNGHLLGGREFKRLERALEARESFRNALDPSRRVEIPFFEDGEAKAIVSHVTRAVASAELEVG